jgi:glycosyltransferase involved in cell wall biosynthesis
VADERDLILVDPNAHSRSASSAEEQPLNDLMAHGVLGLVRHRLFRRRRAGLRTHDIQLMRKPFNKAVLLRLLARGRCWFEDEQGTTLEITFVALLRLFVGRIAARWIVLRGSRALRLELKLLESGPYIRKSYGPGRIIYLRTDLVFGLKSGGSVTHVAGVVNQLARQAVGVTLVSTDVMPLVSKEIDLRLIRPDPRLRDEPEANALLMSLPVADVLVEERKMEPPRFVYQRYSVNSLSGLLVAERLGVPFVLEYNGSEVWVSRNWGGRLRDEATAQRIEQVNLARADLVVVVSKVLAQELERRGIRRERVLVNPNGVDPERYRPDLSARKVVERHDLQGRTVIGFIGSFGPWHGAEVLVNAFGRALERRPVLTGKAALLMIGDGQEMPAVRAAVRRAGLTDSVVLTGNVPQEQGPEYLAACDILVSPHVHNPDGSAFFGSPTKLFEYMAMGRPIVASALEQIGDVLADEETALLVSPGEPSMLADAILRLIESPDLRGQLARNARRVATERYTWRQHTQRILDRLDDLNDGNHA